MAKEHETKVLKYRFTNSMQNKDNNREELEYIIKTKMPFGKYKGYRLINLPEPYLVWFKNKGFPEGKLGKALFLTYEIKLNGLEDLLLNPLNASKKET